MFNTSAHYRGIKVIVFLIFASGFVVPSYGVGTPAGTDISNTADITYQMGGNTITDSTNPVVVTVAEIIDVDVLLQSPQTPVAPGSSNQAILFMLTNTGNGTETFTLSALSTLPGDDFDPLLSSPDNIFFDTDGSGDLSAGDTAYVPGTNDPTLAIDESVSIFVVNDIPAGLLDGNLGQTQLSAVSNTGTGAAGTVIAGGGDGGVDALIGASEGDDSDIGEYIIEAVDLTSVKSATISDPFGGTTPVPGAEITYQIVTTVTGSRTATAAAVVDVIPANTTYVPDSIMLNGAALTDAADADAGEFDAVTDPTVIVQIGDVTNATGPQIVEFKVLIN